MIFQSFRNGILKNDELRSAYCKTNHPDLVQLSIVQSVLYGDEPF